MQRKRVYVWAVAILVAFLAAQFHVCMDTPGFGGAVHACQICASGTWAILPIHSSLSVALAVQPLEKPSFPLAPGLERAESRTPRAPPSV
jgi:hypothetical protein